MNFLAVALLTDFQNKVEPASEGFCAGADPLDWLSYCFFMTIEAYLAHSSASCREACGDPTNAWRSKFYEHELVWRRACRGVLRRIERCLHRGKAFVPVDVLVQILPVPEPNLRGLVRSFGETGGGERGERGDRG